MTSKKLIAVVDDDAAVRMAVTNLIESAGYHAWAFTTATVFLNSRSDLPIVLAITDLWMPDVSGLELLAEMKSRADKVPVILATADLNDSISQQAMDAGASELLRKPFEDYELFAAIERVLLDNSRHDTV